MVEMKLRVMGEQAGASLVDLPLLAREDLSQSGLVSYSIIDRPIYCLDKVEV